MRVVRTVALGVCALLATVSSARAQALGQVAGIVTNPHGAGLAGASLSLDNAGLSEPLVVVTTASGAFEFPRVAVGTYTLMCRLDGFREVIVRRVDVVTGRTATINLTLETAGGVIEMPYNAGRTTTGATIGRAVMLNVPTARDPWQIMRLAPGVLLNGVNVAGSASGQQLTPSALGSSADVQWHIDGATTTDMASNSSAAYYNFDSIDAVQVITGGADVSVASGGVFINLITKSGTNRLSGSVTSTIASNAFQSQNVSADAFASSATLLGRPLTGSPLRHIGVTSGEIGGPIRRDRLWFWGGADNQDIDVTAASFIDTTRSGCSPPPAVFSSVEALQACLADDKTTIRNVNGKLTARLSAATTLALLYQTNQKLRNNRAALGAGASQTDVSSTVSQYGGRSTWTASPTVQATHAWHPASGWLMENQFTHAANNFFLDSHDYTQCGSSSYARDQAGADPTDPLCQWNVQALTNRTTGITTRAPGSGSYQTSRPAWELRTDDHDLVSHVLGGDHAFRFGAGWRKDPVLSYSHQGGGAAAMVQCLGNVLPGCGGSPTPLPVGIVPYEAVISRDNLVHDDWQTFNWYAQDSYTRSRLTVTAGTRWDREASRYLGGCVSANVVVPELLPRQCQGAVDPHQPFQTYSPRVSTTYDLTGDGRTTVRGSVGYYHQTKLLLANSFSDTGRVRLTYGPNSSAGACRALSCWTDANRDGIVQASELTGSPTSSTPFFLNGVLATPLPVIDPALRPGRTREGMIGLDRELGHGLDAAVDLTCRYNDFGSASYSATANAAAGASTLWQRHDYVDPSTGIAAPYYTVCADCDVPVNGPSVLTTSRTHDTDVGVTARLSRRLASRWQGEVSYTWNDSRVFTPVEALAASNNIGNPTGLEFTNGFTNGTPPHDFKAFGYVELPHRFTAGLNLEVRSGSLRTLVIDGPGTVVSGSGQITYATLMFQDAGTTRTPVMSLIDLNLAKTFSLRHATLTLAVDCFNALNAATPLSYLTNDLSNAAEGLTAATTPISMIVPPRVFRIDARFAF